MHKRLLLVLGVITALVLGTATPALADWMQHTASGTPGAIVQLAPYGAEGGICQDPAQTPKDAYYYSCPSSQYQIFIGPFRVYTAPYGVTQYMTVTTHLFEWTGSGWAATTTGTLSTRGCAGSHCDYGYPASDENACPCVPAFNKIPGGSNGSWQSWTVNVVIAWHNYYTGAVLAKANYHPTGASGDIRCAPYAQNTAGRCTSGAYQGTGYVTFK